MTVFGTGISPLCTGWPNSLYVLSGFALPGHIVPCGCLGTGTGTHLLPLSPWPIPPRVLSAQGIWGVWQPGWCTHLSRLTTWVLWLVPLLLPGSWNPACPRQEPRTLQLPCGRVVGGSGAEVTVWLPTRLQQKPGKHQRPFPHFLTVHASIPKSSGIDTGPAPVEGEEAQRQQHQGGPSASRALFLPLGAERQTLGVQGRRRDVAKTK